jgi:hypothetical protein
MSYQTWLQRCAGLAVASASVSACAGFGDVGGMACPELGGGALNGNFAADAKANVTLRAFVQASSDLAKLSAKVEGEVSGACGRIGHDLGLTAAQMGKGTKAKCDAVTAKIDEIMRGGVSIKASFTPPECQVSANAEASCSGQCSGHVDPGSIVANCEPGKLSGSCEGTCGGSCQGTCNGACSGACSAKDAQGKCIGQCQGTCSGQCQGTCHAKCSGTWKAPHCEATVKGPSADVKCQASCKAHAELTAQCTEPRVELQASANTAEMARLVATLRVNLPILVRAELAYGKRIAGQIQTLVQIGGELPGIIGQAGLHAAACVGASANAVLNAQVSLSVSVQASASVSGKAGAHGG